VTIASESRLLSLAEELSRGNLDVLDGAFSTRFFSYEPEGGEPTADERILAIVSDLKMAMPDLSISIDGVNHDGEVFTATVTFTGTHQHPLWGAPATGEPLTWTTPVSIKPIGDTFAVRFDDVSLPDIIGVFRQLGMVNPPDELDQPPRYPITLPDFLLKVVYTGQAGDKPCSHLDQINVVEPSTRACAQCVAEGTIWPALRMCLTCGFVGCCDTSKNKHANQHYQDTGHPLMRSIRMDEAWVWCYEDSAFFEETTLDRYR